MCPKINFKKSRIQTIYIYIYQNNFTKLSNNLKTQKHSECPEIHNRVKTKCSKILICNSYLKNAF